MKDSIDLIPRETVRKRESRSGSTGSLILGAVLLAAIVFVGAALTLRARTVEAALLPLRERVNEMRLLQTRVQPLSESLHTVLQQHVLAQRLLREPQWSGLVGDLAAAVNGQIWVESLQFEQALHSDANPQAPARMIISGSAASGDDLLSFMNALAASPRLSLLAPRESQKAHEGDREGAARIAFVLEGTVAPEGGAQP